MVLDYKQYVFPIANTNSGGNGGAPAKSEFPIVINATIPSASWESNTITLDKNTIPQLEKITADSNILLYPNTDSGEKFFDSGITISSISDGTIVLSRTADGGDLSIQIIILN